MRAGARERGRERIAELAGLGLDAVSFWREAEEVLARVVSFDGGACWASVDPASLLVTSHFNVHTDVFPAEFLVAEYYRDDVHKIADVLRSPRGISTLHEATGGDPASSPHGRDMLQHGIEQEVVASLRSPGGEPWGCLRIHRDAGARLFDAAELAFVRAIGPALGEGTRRGILLGEALDPEGPDAPGLVVLTESWEVESATPGVDRWVSDLPGGDLGAGRLPPAVLSVASRAMRSAEGRDGPGEVALARVRTRSGAWVVLHGTPLVAAGSRRIAVIVESAQPARIAPLLMSAYGLSERERDVTRLVLRGESTAAIADRLVLSPHTVQQHLKSIFGKTGVRSRRDLVGKVFFSHYEPRLRENEERVPQDLPLRGGPKPLA